MVPILNLIVLYAKDIQRTASFYERCFDFTSRGSAAEGLVELVAPSGGASILVLQAGKGVKHGQAVIKLTFSVQDVEAFKENSAALGLEFGGTHQANGYAFANAKDPDGNSVSISNRAYRLTDVLDNPAK